MDDMQDSMLSAELAKEAFLRSSTLSKAADDPVRLIEAFSSDKWNLDTKRPGLFNRHSLFGDIKDRERYAQIYTFMALECLRSACGSITTNTWKEVLDSDEMTSSFIGFSSRSLRGKERTLLSKTITELIQTRDATEKKRGGISRFIPFRGGVK